MSDWWLVLDWAIYNLLIAMWVSNMHWRAFKNVNMWYLNSIVFILFDATFKKTIFILKNVQNETNINVVKQRNVQNETQITFWIGNNNLVELTRWRLKIEMTLSLLQIYSTSARCSTLKLNCDHVTTFTHFFDDFNLQQLL